jgi:hypothetical protein
LAPGDFEAETKYESWKEEEKEELLDILNRLTNKDELKTQIYIKAQDALHIPLKEKEKNGFEVVCSFKIGDQRIKSKTYPVDEQGNVELDEDFVFDLPAKITPTTPISLKLRESLKQRSVCEGSALLSQFVADKQSKPTMLQVPMKKRSGFSENSLSRSLSASMDESNNKSLSKSTSSIVTGGLLRTIVHVTRREFVEVEVFNLNLTNPHLVELMEMDHYPLSMLFVPIFATSNDPALQWLLNEYIERFRVSKTFVKLILCEYLLRKLNYKLHDVQHLLTAFEEVTIAIQEKSHKITKREKNQFLSLLSNASATLDHAFSTVLESFKLSEPGTFKTALKLFELVQFGNSKMTVLLNDTFTVGMVNYYNQWSDQVFDAYPDNNMKALRVLCDRLIQTLVDIDDFDEEIEDLKLSLAKISAEVFRVRYEQELRTKIESHRAVEQEMKQMQSNQHAEVFDLFERVKELDRLCSINSKKIAHIPIEEIFDHFIGLFVEEQKDNLTKWAINILSYEKWEMITKGKIKYSNSVVDLFSSFAQIAEMIVDMNVSPIKHMNNFLNLVCETVDLFATQLIRFMFEELENEVDLKAHEQQWIELQAMVDQTERDVELASIDVTVTQKLKTYKFMPCITQRLCVQLNDLEQLRFLLKQFEDEWSTSLKTKPKDKSNRSSVKPRDRAKSNGSNNGAEEEAELENNYMCSKIFKKLKHAVDYMLQNVMIRAHYDLIWAVEFLGFKNNLTLYKPNTAGLQLQQLDSRNFRSNVNSTVKHTMQRMSVSISKSITKSGELLKVQLPNIPTKYTEISQQITYWHVTDETRAMFLTQYLKRQIKALNKWLFPSNMIRGLKILFDFTILEIERLLLPRNIMENKVDRVKLYYTLQKTFKTITEQFLAPDYISVSAFNGLSKQFINKQSTHLKNAFELFETPVDYLIHLCREKEVQALQTTSNNTNTSAENDTTSNDPNKPRGSIDSTTVKESMDYLDILSILTAKKLLEPEASKEFLTLKSSLVLAGNLIQKLKLPHNTKIIKGFYCCNSSYLLGELFVTNQHLAFNLLSPNMEEFIIVELNDIQGFEASGKQKTSLKVKTKEGKTYTLVGFLDEKYINLVIEAVNKAREGAEDYKEQYVHKQQEYSKITKKMRNKFDLPDTEEVKKKQKCTMGLSPGTIYVFESYVCFKATLGGDKHVIPVTEITQIKQQALLGLINNSMAISLKNGVELNFKFPLAPDSIVTMIKEHHQKAKLKENLSQKE